MKSKIGFISQLTFEWSSGLKKFFYHLKRRVVRQTFTEIYLFCFPPAFNLFKVFFPPTGLTDFKSFIWSSYIFSIIYVVAVKCNFLSLMCQGHAEYAKTFESHWYRDLCVFHKNS